MPGRKVTAITLAALMLLGVAVVAQGPGQSQRQRQYRSTQSGSKASPKTGGKATPGPIPGFVTLPAGQFERGDHHGFVDPKHGSDEIPIRTLHISAFAIAVNDVTNKEYCDFLNATLAQKWIEVHDGGVYLKGGKVLLCETRQMSPYSRIGWNKKAFSVLDQKENHPMVCVRWEGAAVYCNWLSGQHGFPRCYASTWECNFNKSGFRLPTEAEWEYAARGGQYNPYWNFACSNEADPTRANWPESKNPYRSGPQPWTTPVGFFDGKTHRKSDENWPGVEENFTPGNGVNGFGLYDMAGNVWQWCTEWYERRYYEYCPDTNPPGPAQGSPMPDGKTYRCMRGGNWFNGEWGHARVSNRDPSYFRGPQDPNHPFYHIGFRPMLPIDAEKRPVTKPTPVPQMASAGDIPGGRPPRDGGGPGGGRRQRRGDAQQGGDHGEQAGDRRDDRGPNDNDRPPRDNDRPGRRQEKAVTDSPLAISMPNPGFVLRSPVVTEGGALPKEFTGDGSSASPPLDWSGAPEGTQSYALIMHHLAPNEIKWYWVLYNIPLNVTSLPKNVQGVGTSGSNSVNNIIGYAPPHSKGPGVKKYTLTLYALSGPPQISLPAKQVNREVLLSAMKGLVLATAQLNVTYTREFTSGEEESRPPRDDDRPPPRQPRQ